MALSHSSRLHSAADIGATWGAMSRAISTAWPSTRSAGSARLAIPSATASAPVEGAPREQPLGGPPQGGQMRQRPVRHAVGYHAPSHLHHTVFGVLGDHADVGLQGDRQADSDGVAVERGDHRFTQLEGGRVDRRRRERAVVGGGVERRYVAREIRSDAKGAARTGYHDGADVVVTVALAVRPAQQRAHLGGIGVEMFGTIQRQLRHALVDVDRHVGAHRIAPYSDSWNSTMSASASTASLSAVNRSAADGADSTV